MSQVREPNQDMSPQAKNKTSMTNQLLQLQIGAFFSHHSALEGKRKLLGLCGEQKGLFNMFSCFYHSRGKQKRRGQKLRLTLMPYLVLVIATVI